MELETLKAKLVATSTLKQTLDSTARSADDVGDELQRSAAAGELLATGADDAEDEIDLLKRQLEQANREAAQGAAANAAYAEGLDDVARSSAEASAAAALAQRQIDEVGEEALRSALEVETFDAALNGIGGSDVRARLFGISGGLRTIAAALAALTPAALGAAGALSGLAAAAGTAGVGLFGLTAAGIQSQAESLAAVSEELESAADAREQILGNVAGQLEAATDPLQNAATEQFAIRNLEAFVEVVGAGAEALADIQPLLLSLGRDARALVTTIAPEVFRALTGEIEDLEPLLREFGGIVRDLPGLIRFFGDAAERIGPDLFTFGAALGDVLGGLTSLGVAVLDVVLPPLNALLFAGGALLGLFEVLPDPLQNAAIAFGVTATAAVVLSGGLGILSTAAGVATTAVTALTGSVTLLGGVLTLPVAALAALVAGAVALATRFGLLDDIVGGLVATWNGFIGAVEAVINTAFRLYDALGILGPILFPTIAVIEAVAAALNLLGSAFAFVVDIAGDVLAFVTDVVDRIANRFDGLIGTIDAVTDALGIDQDLSVAAEEQRTVDLSAAEIGGGGSGDDDGDSGGRSRAAAQQSAAAPTGGRTPTNVDMSNSQFIGTNETEMKQFVREAVREATRSSRDREDAQGV